ncbi:MAG: helix-turn-helix domain-containing protein [Candidatus Norongarragalinales archaeon]
MPQQEWLQRKWLFVLPELGEVKKRRKALNLTQSALARLAGVSQSFIAKVERGKSDPAYSLAKRVFDALEALETKTEKRAR